MSAHIKVETHSVTLTRGKAHLVLTLPDALALCDLLPPLRYLIEDAERARLKALAVLIEADLAAVRADLQALLESGVVRAGADRSAATGKGGQP